MSPGRQVKCLLYPYRQQAGTCARECSLFEGCLIALKTEKKTREIECGNCGFSASVFVDFEGMLTCICGKDIAPSD